MTSSTVNVLIYILLGTICLSGALPYQSLSPELNYDNNEDNRISSNSISQATQNSLSAQDVGRQAGIIAALGAALLPLLAGFIGPVISQLASAISSAVLGRLQSEGFPLNLNATKEPLQNYDGYMINMPNSPGPYLFLTTPNEINRNSQKKPIIVPTPTGLPFSPSYQDPLSLSGSPYTTLKIKSPPVIKQHLGTINIKPDIRPEVEDVEEKSHRSTESRIRELTILNTPSYNVHNSEEIVK